MAIKENLVKLMTGVALLLPKADEEKYGIAAKMGVVINTQEWLMFKAAMVSKLTEEEILKGGYAEEWMTYCYEFLQKMQE